jgi:hypothetical protein
LKEKVKVKGICRLLKTLSRSSSSSCPEEKHGEKEESGSGRSFISRGMRSDLVEGMECLLLFLLEGHLAETSERGYK